MNFESIIRMPQKKLFKKLCVPGCIFKRGSYILIPGKAPVMLVAHLDTVHKEPVRDVCYDAKRNIIMSPQGIGGDDRCGVYALTQVHKRATQKPWLLFTSDEEIGCIGARQFCADHKAGYLPDGLDSLKLIIEIDRKGSNDAVYYECANEDLEEYITSKGFETDWGSCSDISEVAPELGVAAVNLSSGYYNPHTLSEYIVLSDLWRTINRVIEIVNESSTLPQYPYIEAAYTGGYSGYSWRGAAGFGRYDWYGAGYNKYDFGAEKAASFSGARLTAKTMNAKREYLLDIGYTDKELDDIEDNEGSWAIDELYRTEKLSEERWEGYSDKINNAM